MSQRVLLDAANGEFRISRPGKDVSSTDPRDFIFREDMATYWPLYTGSATVGSGNTTTNVTLPAAVTGLPFIVLKCSDGALPSGPDTNGHGIFALIAQNGSSMTIYSNGARTITYFVFGNPYG